MVICSAWPTHTEEATSIDVECGWVKKTVYIHRSLCLLNLNMVVGKLQTTFHCLSKNLTFSLLLLKVHNIRADSATWCSNMNIYSNIHAKIGVSHQCWTVSVCQSVSHHVQYVRSLCSSFLWFVEVSESSRCFHRFVPGVAFILAVCTLHPRVWWWMFTVLGVLVKEACKACTSLLASNSHSDWNIAIVQIGSLPDLRTAQECLHSFAKRLTFWALFSCGSLFHDLSTLVDC